MLSDIRIGKKHEYRLGTQISSSRHYELYQGIHLKTKKQVSIKLVKASSAKQPSSSSTSKQTHSSSSIAKQAPSSSSSSSIAKQAPSSSSSPSSHEAKYYHRLKHGPGIPRLLWSGKEGQYGVLITEPLGPTMETQLRACDSKFSVKTLLLIAEQLLSTIEFMHSRGILHRRVCPANISLGPDLHTIQLAHFEHARSFVDSSGAHIPFREGKSFVGSSRFASAAVHQGHEHGRKDDLESWMYCLLYFYHGELPWQHIRAATRKQKLKRIGQKKTNISVTELVSRSPPEFEQIMTYIRSLRFADAPDYLLLHHIIADMFARRHFHSDLVFDWSPRPDPQLLPPPQPYAIIHSHSSSSVPSSAIPPPSHLPSPLPASHLAIIPPPAANLFPSASTPTLNSTPSQHPNHQPHPAASAIFPASASSTSITPSAPPTSSSAPSPSGAAPCKPSLHGAAHLGGSRSPSPPLLGVPPLALPSPRSSSPRSSALLPAPLLSDALQRVSPRHHADVQPPGFSSSTPTLLVASPRAAPGFPAPTLSVSFPDAPRMLTGVSSSKATRKSRLSKKHRNHPSTLSNHTNNLTSINVTSPNHHTNHNNMNHNNNLNNNNLNNVSTTHDDEIDDDIHHLNNNNNNNLIDSIAPPIDPIPLSSSASASVLFPTLLSDAKKSDQPDPHHPGLDSALLPHHAAAHSALGGSGIFLAKSGGNGESQEPAQGGAPFAAAQQHQELGGGGAAESHSSFVFKDIQTAEVMYNQLHQSVVAITEQLLALQRDNHHLRRLSEECHLIQKENAQMEHQIQLWNDQWDTLCRVAEAIHPSEESQPQAHEPSSSIIQLGSGAADGQPKWRYKGVSNSILSRVSFFESPPTVPPTTTNTTLPNSLS